MQIPIDDFVTGDLPPVCVGSGVESSTVVEFENDRGVVRGWWGLLLFLGPCGLLAMVGLYALSPRPIPVRGLLPMTRAAHDDRNRAVWALRRAYALGAVATLAAIVALAAFQSVVGLPGSALMVVLVGLVFVWILALPAMEFVNRRRNQIAVVAMAGGRWVEVRGAHPEFVRAVERQNRQRHHARSQVGDS